MTREHSPKRDLMREQLAHQAAKLMAEGGITDHASAKRKAARQLGAADTQHLPATTKWTKRCTQLPRALPARQPSRHPAPICAKKH